MRSKLADFCWRLLRRRGWRPVADGTLGQRGEQLATRFLQRRGLKILDTHLQLPAGEIDIVAVDRGMIVFVEVKTRQTNDIRDALEAVDLNKQRQLTRLALTYLKRRRWLDRPSRFDVVGIAWPVEGEPAIEHVVNAFEPPGQGQMYC